MPLLDHFHGPLAFRPWQSIHSQWCGCMVASLNRNLPKQFVADGPMNMGAVSADVVEYEPRPGVETTNGAAGPGHGGGGGLALAVAPETAQRVYAPPETDLHMPAAFPPEMYIEVRDTAEHYRVVAVVEVVSPANKKEASEREQFAAKCLNYVGHGIGLVVVDVVTNRGANLHNELVRIAGHDPTFAMPGDPPIYATAYRPVRRKKDDLIDLWRWPLAVGSALPTVPLALKGYGCVPLDLEATYAEACERSRLSPG